MQEQPARRGTLTDEACEHNQRTLHTSPEALLSGSFLHEIVQTDLSAQTFPALTGNLFKPLYYIFPWLSNNLM